MIKTKADLIKLYLLVVFPIHAWTIILFLRDYEWIAERSDSWGALGVLAYALSFALFESLVVFIAIWLMSLLLPSHWHAEKRIRLLVTLFYVLVVWMAVLYPLQLIAQEEPATIANLLLRIPHPLRAFQALYAGMLLIMTFSFIFPVVWEIRSAKPSGLIIAVAERLTVLSAFYLVFDLVGIVIVILRNVL